MKVAHFILVFRISRLCRYILLIKAHVKKLIIPNEEHDTVPPVIFINGKIQIPNHKTSLL